VAVRAARTRGITFTGNRWRAVDSALVLRDTSGFTGQVTSPPGDTLSPALPAEFARLAPVPAGTYPSSALTRRDRSAIVVDEWGPFDWQSPKLWPVDSTRAVPLGLAVLGPPGRWRVITRRGIARLSLRMGKVGDTIAVTPAADSTGDWRLALEYDGAAMVTPRGERRAAGRPYRFSYERFEPTIDWAVRFFSWSDTAAIRERGVTGGTALFERHASRLDYEWYRPPIPDLPRERWALQATGTVQLAPGDYTLRTISDDGVRVWVDGALAIDAWTPHESAVDVVRLPGGRHDLRVEYYQADGWTELRVEIVRGYFLK
jgi:hypothetical protein